MNGSGRIPWTSTIRGGLTAAVALSACASQPQSALPLQGLDESAPDLLVMLAPGTSAGGDLIQVAPGVAGYRIRKGESLAAARAKLRGRPGVAGVEPNVRIRVPDDWAPAAPATRDGSYRVQAVLPIGATPGAPASGGAGSNLQPVGGTGTTPTPVPLALAPVGGDPQAQDSPPPGAGLPQFLGFLPPSIDDPLYYRQWHLPAIGIPEAWQIEAGMGFTPPLVAVLDTGVDGNHPDLEGRTYYGPSYVAGAATSRDDHGHGTVVAGVIGATPGNAIGVASVAPQVRILAIKVLDSTGTGTLGGVVAGIFAGIAAGARVLNLSFGTPIRSAVLDMAIAEAVAAGVIVVAAAGNDGTDTAVYPAALPGVLAVTAVDAQDRRASFASGGPEVRLAAPGVGIVSLGKGGTYTIGSGTSEAAPIVTGAIATMLAFKPTLSASTAGDILFGTGKSTSGFTAAVTKRVDLAGALAVVRQLPAI